MTGESTDNRLATAYKGSLRLTLHTDGVSAHSAYPEHGRSAIDALIDVLSDLRRTSWPSDPVLGDTTLNVGVIAGGTRPNPGPAEARAELPIPLLTDPAPVQPHAQRPLARRPPGRVVRPGKPRRLAT